LDTIGEFGLRKLRGEGSEREFRLRHRDWYGRWSPAHMASAMRSTSLVAGCDPLVSAPGLAFGGGDACVIRARPIAARKRSGLHGATVT
jgi:hypothetical protein